MQDLNKLQLEVGDTVRIDWPRTRWDGRKGILVEIPEVIEGHANAVVLLDGYTVRVALEKLAGST